MVNVKCYIPINIYQDLENRCNSLQISKSEYLRLLATLDIYNRKYNILVKYVNIMEQEINDICSKLGLSKQDSAILT